MYYFLNLIASVAKHFPKAVMGARIVKGLHRFPRLNCKFEDIPYMFIYVSKAAIANGSNPVWAVMADKYASREFVAKRIGEEHLIPLYGHWENPEDIDFDSLKPPYILKTNNGCGTNIFVHEDTKVDRDEIIRTMKKALAFPYPELTGQLHYSMIKPCVIAEKLMTQGAGERSLIDYKVQCVNGVPQRIIVISDRGEGKGNNFSFKIMTFDTDWNPLPETVSEEYRDNPEHIKRPDNLEEMLEMASKLSVDEEFLRVDFYIIDGKIYFGELTCTPDTAIAPVYVPEGMNAILDKIKADRKAGKSKRPF
ncbi:MAG: hypothetical protein K2M06_03240 [Muribaculaceae bacterium]|nr:hypothetical protein [Muribaculaceae bacterium]